MAEAMDRLAHTVATQQWDDLPDDVREQARFVFLDSLGVMLYGSQAPEVGALTARLTATGGQGATVLTRHFPAADPRTAALLNGIAGRTPELCETHRIAHSQAAMQLLPAALATAEHLELSGRELLTALVLGYEVATRIGLVATARPRAHQNGQWPLLGAVAAGARLHRFDAAQTSQALNAGAVLLLTPSYMHVATGATTLNAAGGMSGFAGVLVPELILSGFEPAPDAVEQAFDGLVGDGFASERLNEDLGHRWEITRNHFRLRACCVPIYPALDALEAALAELRPTPEQIDRIEFATYAFASVMRQPDPPNEFAAHYSLPHATAVIVARGKADSDCFVDEAIHDPIVANLRRRVIIREDPALNASLPETKSARVTVTLTDGRTSTRVCSASRGGFDHPYARAELVEKFRTLSRATLTPDGVSEVEQLALHLDELASVGDLMAALRRKSLAPAAASELLTVP